MAIRTQIRATGATNVGRVRTNNEDSYLLNIDLGRSDLWNTNAAEQYIPLPEAGTLLVVADGMGGANAGEVASGLTVDLIRKEIGSNPYAFQKDTESNLKRLLRAANELIARESKVRPDAKGMGTTCVLALVFKDRAHVAWVGDSRAYLFNRNAGGLKAVSKDHSLVQTLVDAGKLTDEQAFYHPDNNVITQSLGDSGRTIDPGYVTVDICQEDILMLCSDGLNGMLLDKEIAAIMYGTTRLQDMQQQLIAAANDKGGSDNISVVLAEFINSRMRNAAQPLIPPPPAATGGLPKWLMYGISLMAGVLLAALGLYILSDDPKDPHVNEGPKQDTVQLKVLQPTSTLPEDHNDDTGNGSIKDINLDRNKEKPDPKTDPVKPDIKPEIKPDKTKNNGLPTPNSGNSGAHSNDDGKTVPPQDPEMIKKEKMQTNPKTKAPAKNNQKTPIDQEDLLNKAKNEKEKSGSGGRL